MCDRHLGEPAEHRDYGDRLVFVDGVEASSESVVNRAALQGTLSTPESQENQCSPKPQQPG